MGESSRMSSPPVPAVDLGASSMRAGLGTDRVQQASIRCSQVQIQMPRKLKCVWVARACVTRVSFRDSFTRTTRAARPSSGREESSSC